MKKSNTGYCKFNSMIKKCLAMSMIPQDATLQRYFPYFMHQRQSERASIAKSQAQRKGLKRAIFAILAHSD